MEEGEEGVLLGVTCLCPSFVMVVKEVVVGGGGVDDVTSATEHKVHPLIHS